MNIEFHYYITYIIALRAGYSDDEAFKIAYSSQYTDDNNREYSINTGKADSYNNYISQTYDITKPRKKLIRIHPMFHFFPGTTDEIVNGSLPRHDGKLHLLNTIPGNKNAQEVFKDAIVSKNLYRIGIGTHMFADTYSHQNFAGVRDSFNEMKGLLSMIIPNVGHADAQHNPDLVNFRWKDKRHTSKYISIDNNARFLDAAEHIFCLFCSLAPQITGRQINKRKLELRAEIGQAVSIRNEDKRINRYRELIGDGFIEYNKSSWFREAVSIRLVNTTRSPFSRKKRVHLWKGNHKKRDWYRFQQAVKGHQKRSEQVLGPVFARMEVEKINIW
jgi:hypothetical protein